MRFSMRIEGSSLQVVSPQAQWQGGSSDQEFTASHLSYSFQALSLVFILVVVLGRFFVEDENEHDDEDDFQESYFFTEDKPAAS